MIYWDSSVVLKLYVSEMDSDQWQKLLIREARPLVASALLQTEIACALRHKASSGEISGRDGQALLKLFYSDIEAGRIQLIPIGSDVLEESVAIVQSKHLFDLPLLRSLDAIHLATLRILNCKTIATADKRMTAVAEALGVSVVVL